MKNALLLTTLLMVQSPVLFAQGRLTSQEFGEYYDWFNEHSQTADLYSDRATLHIFSDKAALQQGPCRDSRVLTRLPIGLPVTNIVEDAFFLPEDEIDGYFDIWYFVAAQDPSGRTVEGYLWGGDLAKSWTAADLTGDGNDEFLMLGIASQPRQKITDINAEIRILHNDRLWYQKLVPGLCVFEACATSGLLRVIENDQAPGGMQVVEASTMTLGCWAGVEKAFFYWNGGSLERVYYAEFTSDREYERRSFLVENGPTTQLCLYSHEDENYNPVWACRTVKTEPAPTDAQAAVASTVARH